MGALIGDIELVIGTLPHMFKLTHKCFASLKNEIHPPLNKYTCGKHHMCITVYSPLCMHAVSISVTAKFVTV